MLTVDQIISLIDREDIRVISFDLFDTLLVRPSIQPRDIFSLLQKKAEEEYHVDFVKIRYTAEEETKNEFVTLDEIWRHIEKKNHLKPEVAQALKCMEMQLERNLLTARRDTRRLYEAAVRSGKQIIVISDMYLPSDFLKAVLKEKGFGEIAEVFVSCEQKARKSSGALYRRVLEQGKLEDPSELLHIGDNFQSDYKAALEQGITAVYYPSVWDMTMSADSTWGKVLHNQKISEDPIIRILYSFVFLHAWNKNDKLLYGRRCFPDAEAFADLLLAPMLTQLGVEMLCDPAIQEKYDSLFFAARDGYLPKKVYDALGKNTDHIPSCYLYVSRQALCYSTYKSFMDYFEHSRWEGKEYLLKDFISIFVADEQIREQILRKLTKEEQMKNLCTSGDDVYQILKRFKSELESYFANQKKLAETYYKSVIGQKKDHQLVFDCGYGGSVSNGLQRATEIPFDKIYLWQTKENRSIDQKNKTETHCFFGGEPFRGFNIIFEECFSPLEGSCLGFSEDHGRIKPLLENLKISHEMRQTLNMLETCCIAFAEAFEKYFSEYYSSLRAKDHTIFLDVIRYAFLESPYNELNIFDAIVFPDSHGPQMSLSKKTYENFMNLRYYTNSFQGTMFDNPDTIMSPNNKIIEPQKGYRIGIHLHLHNKYLAEEILDYLKTIEYPFDLYITITDQKFEPVLKKLYSQTIVPELMKLTIITTENRGRDVAPWLVEMREVQNQYDLFCHIHGKESAQYGGSFGTKWRQYLFDNLIDGDAVDKIITLFQENEELGLVFPASYPPIRSIHNDRHIPVSGDYGEPEIIRDLLQKMGIEEYFSRDNFIFSMGTMMWYRPKALTPLFSLGLKYDDFPEEPIGVGGTIAHAIERIPSTIVKSTGYTTGQFNLIPEGGRGVTTPGDDREQIARRIGVKSAVQVVYQANIIFLKKKLGFIRKVPDDLNSYDTYDIARSNGLKNALIILRKAIGSYLLK